MDPTVPPPSSTIPLDFNKNIDIATSTEQGPSIDKAINVEKSPFEFRNYTMSFNISFLCIIKFIIGLIALYLSWNCNANSNFIIRIITTFFSTIFSEIYIVYYSFYRTFMGIKCY